MLVLFAVLFTPLCVKESASAATKPNYSGAKTAIIAAYKSYSTEVDVSKYNINYKKNYKKLKKMMSEIVNNTPELFYTGTSYTVSRKKSNDMVVKIGLGYSSTYAKSSGAPKKGAIKKAKAKLDTAVSTAIGKLDSKMTKIEKALVLHDYIVSTTAYNDKKANTSRVKDYGALVDHKANCQGYTIAYMLLLNKAGIKSKIIQSEKMNHMWNKVKIGKYWLNVDVTFDDPVDAIKLADQYGVVKHDYFMLSDKKLKKGEHYGYSVGKLTSTTKYDKKYWQKVNSAFVRNDGKWLYISPSGVCERETVLAKTFTLLYSAKIASFVRFKDNIYYYIDYKNNAIYKYTISDNSANLLWKCENYYKSPYALKQIKVSGNYIAYKVGNGTGYKTGKLAVESSGNLA